ncbi:MAG: glycosyltransferase family 4 protein [Actinomycetia bacterium]|nr:glycosyltransferase family 4 protein [Actinomycetes bacterium]
MHVLILTWRDSGHPEAGGSETFVERVSEGLIALGHDVTVFTAGYPGASAREVRDQRVFLRRGRRYSVYGRAALHLAGRRRYDVVLDIQNGVPFWTPLWTRTPVVNVVHHVHREQWPEVFGPLRSRFGWWLESDVAPRVYAGRPYVTVSEASRDELAALGVAPERVEVVYSGNDLPRLPADWAVPRTPHPSLVVLGRLVPHKRVELALEAVHRLSDRFPDLRLTVVGQGYWEPELKQTAHRLGVADRVDFVGFVEEDVKHRLLASSWLHLLPSVKEGWGLVVVEAGFHGTPTVAFRSAGGTTESVVHGVTGLLADDDDGFVHSVERLLDEHGIRAGFGAAARSHARRFSWEATTRGVERALLKASGRPTPSDHTDEETVVPQGEVSARRTGRADS